MTLLEGFAVVVAGIAAGTINTVVGSGALISFPALIAVGYSPLVANVSTSLGLVPGSLSGAYGYRRELTGQTDRVRRFLPASVLGSLAGAVLLLVLPAKAFATVVPVLIAIALILVVAQPWLNRRLAKHERHQSREIPLWFGLLLTAVYGGYFGAAQGVITLALMEILTNENLQRLNALKNVLIAAVNLAAGIVFIVFAHVAWLAVLLLAVGSLIGGQLGAKIGRRLPSFALRSIIVLVGIAAIIRLVLP